MTKQEYQNYCDRFARFMQTHGLCNLTAKSDENGTSEPYFSWSPCECCHRPLGGDRYDADGYSATQNCALEFTVCPDCIYYAEYGQLDDMTMLEMEE